MRIITHNFGRGTLITVFILYALKGLGSAQSPQMYERTYTTNGRQHLQISNVNGDISVSAWNRNDISVRAMAAPAVQINDKVVGNSISVTVKRDPNPGRSDFTVTAPPDTSIYLKNIDGKITIQGMAGHIGVDSITGDIRLVNMKSESLDVKVITGDILFDGELAGAGPYNLQSMKGNIDVTIPPKSSFNLTAKVLKNTMNLGGFSFNESNILPKFMSGTHSKGGPPLTITSYDGVVRLHPRN